MNFWFWHFFLLKILRLIWVAFKFANIEIVSNIIKYFLINLPVKKYWHELDEVFICWSWCLGCLLSKKKNHQNKFSESEQNFVSVFWIVIIADILHKLMKVFLILDPCCYVILKILYQVVQNVFRVEFLIFVQKKNFFSIF